MAHGQCITFGLTALLLCVLSADLHAQSIDEKQSLAQQSESAPAQGGVPPQTSSQTNDVAEKIAKLEAEVEKLKKKPKDDWDKFQIIAALMIPASIALTGFLISKAIKQAEIDSSERIAQAEARSAEQIALGEKEVALINAKVSQAQLIRSFLPSLTGAEAHHRKLAIQALLLALPEDGPRLVQILSEADPDPAVQKFADDKLAALSQRDLLPYIFHSDAQISNKARDRFLSDRNTDTWTLLMLMQETALHHDIKHGVLNALKILDSFGPYESRVLQTAFERMSDLMDKNDEDVQTAVNAAMARFTT